MNSQDKIYQIKIGILETNPLVWRRFLVPSRITLHRLHLVLQCVMGWKNYHLYRFKQGEKEYGEPDPENDFNELHFASSKRIKLGDIVREERSLFLYEYDFGDCWEHQILVERILEREDNKQYPVCLAGENACPPEDSGGTWGYAEKLDIIQNHEHEEYLDIKTWLGKGFDPKKFDIKTVNRRLLSMRLK